MTRLRQQAAGDASAARQFAPWQDDCPPEDLYADMRRHSSPLIKALADAEWAAMDWQGRLPADWEERRAAIVAQFGEVERG